MNISSNFAVLLTLGETQKNNKNINKLGKIVASGQKINSAQDDASAYSISEKMKSQLRVLSQDIINSSTGRNLVNVAEGGIQEIVNNLRFLKEKAIDAANDTNTDKDREIIQKEVNQRLDVIDDIAATTNYNGRLLLDGTWGERGPHLLDRLSSSDSSDSTEPAGSGTIIPKGNYTINADGVYIMSKGYEGHITINAENVKIMQEDPTELIRKTSIECTNSGSNLWLEDVSIVNTQYVSNPYAVNRNLIKFTGSDNTLNIKGNVTLENGGTPTSEVYAVVNVGEGLSIYGHGEKSDLRVIQFDIGGGRNSSAAAIGTDSGINNPSNPPDIYIANLSKLQTFSEDGPSIGAGNGTTIGDITIANVGILDVNTSNGTGIGAVNHGRGAATVKSDCGSITIQADKFYGAGMSGDSKVLKTSAGKIDIESEYIYLAVRPSESSDGYRKLSSSGGSTIDPPGSATVNGTPFNPSGKTYTPNPSYTNSQVYVYPDYDKKDGGLEAGVEGKRRLIIHTGTNSSENMNVIINSMDTWTLGLKDMKVTTRGNAVSAISKIDKAIEYSLGENTRLGAYHTRLGFTIDNLTTAHENTTVADSVIRDADMAKSMTEYAKANVLGQASQSMLAQANQNMSNVLSLLQG